MVACVMAAISIQGQENYRIPVSEEHEQMMTGQYEPTWQSVLTHEPPEWFRNAKFGIWAHWGPQCVEGSGDIGHNLFDTMMAFNESHKNRRGWPRGEDWTLGDQPIVGILLNTNQDTDHYIELPAPRITADTKYDLNTRNRPIRVYTDINSRIMLDDFFAKMQLACNVIP